MIKSNTYIKAEDLFEWNINLKLGLTTSTQKKGELFLEEGQRCDYFYYILKGFVRLYYLDVEGNEVTHWFSAEDSMVTSPFSFFKKEKNILYFEALEDTELLLISNEQLDKIMSQSKSTQKAYRHLLAEFAMVLSRRIMSIHTETAEDRYLKLMREHPLIFQKAKLSHIASFLGITPQSLSRVRKNI
ncbi:Crp/Fnr family transcriptional regulator [Winogradskyella sp.]|uniref:Crp/Fnr family transcriptional regulator n=1 Tax=Winogradskyella sp. TaxID=1883156 RepID=UPI003BAAA923